MDKIYILKKDKVMSGPYSLTTIAQNGLQASDRIWYEGLPQWMPAQQVSSLKKMVRPTSISFLNRLFKK
jgi:GYF domain 2